jgi:hypothetical protein
VNRIDQSHQVCAVHFLRYSPSPALPGARAKQKSGTPNQTPLPTPAQTTPCR